MKKKNNLILMVLVTLFFISLGSFTSSTSSSRMISLSTLMSQIESNNIEKATVMNEMIVGSTKDGTKFKTLYPNSYVGEILNQMNNKGVVYEFIGIDGQRTLLDRVFSLIGFLISWLPMMIISWLMISPFISRKSDKNNNSGGGMFSNNPFSFGKSKAKAMLPHELKVRFSDVAGIEEAKEDIAQIVDFLKDPIKYHDIGGKIPRGCLLIGQPGTGKTLLAKAIASEAQVPFFFISGSDFVEMFVGVGASRVRDMFAQAKKQSPCIIFIDEIDAVGRHRGAGVGGGNDEREQTLNQLLVEMDGFQENSGIVVIAATNRPDVLDSALLRPGRFDRQIVVNLPDIKGREAILSVHISKVKTAPDVDLHVIARGTPGFAGADLANIVNEAALWAARIGKKVVTMKDLEHAKDKVMMGSERKSVVMKQSEKDLTAYHEAGHAILALNLPASDPIHKATIIPRGMALGLVMRLPEEDRFSMTREKMIADMIVAMGGRVAEEMIFGYDKVTSGASSDIQQVTDIARNMVTKWGLSDKLGNVNYSVDESGRSSHKGAISDETTKLIDEEIKKFVDSAYSEAKKILNEKRNDLETLAKALLEFETLSGDEIKQVLRGEKIVNIENPNNDNNSRSKLYDKFKGNNKDEQN